MDQAVLKTQQWLNKTYIGKSGYIKVSEDGVTGWGTMKGLTTALQIELGISLPNGNFGPATTAAFANLASGSTKANQIYILQGALFCKGYNPGGFNGTFGNGTKNAVTKLQSDAGLSNPTGIVNSLLMKSLLSMDAFVLLNYGEFYGNSGIRTIQQNLNRDYSANKYFAKDIGLVPCDGIYGRSTNKALLYALQIEEGISVPNGVFGPATKANCPTIPTRSTNPKFIFLLQYALYCNGFDPNGFDGKFGDGAIKAVTNFQKFTCLYADGIAGPQTWASLLVSTGDALRKGTMCDCATSITPARAQTLVANKYKSVGRYLTGKFKMTSSELKTIFAAGLKVFPIFETGGYQLSYFNALQGNKDAKAAIAAASSFGFDSGAIIYFTVDFDALDGNVTSSILPYFSEIYQVFKRTGTTYKIGIYAPRNVCSRVSQAGYSCSSFVCDMSSGFSGNLGYPLPKDWAIDQISTISLGSGDGLIEIDNNISSGRDLGVSSVNPGNNAAGIPDPFTPSIPTPTTPLIPLSNGFEYIVVSGKEKDVENGVNRYKYNFIETALKKLYGYYQNKKNIPSGSVRLKDTYTWLIHKFQYTDSDIAHFQATANRFGYNIVIFNSNEEFINYINSGSLSGNDTRNQLIKEFTMFSHGHPGDICFSTLSNGDDTPFYTSDIAKLNKNVFYDNKSEFYSCNVATGTPDENKLFESFGYTWSIHFRCSSVKACFRKTTYEYICNKSTLENLTKKIDRIPYGYIQTGSYNYPEPTDETSDSTWVWIFPLIKS
ncbi:glycoside hydrolase domain-containing protein [Clostridium sp. HBUAS56017]|uniref:glycoside hydrolase domain-containing protein n=1 Tax=Clostridium sp. HBUAS56017 TaxID=2571128 RepID=UPI001178762F|nr:glycoside hydrolase domain-containing protein [Clostridium sp. HBUAS56017]